VTVPSVDVVGLSKSFGLVTALTDVSLTVAPGEVYALLGANGAGKSTLKRCLLGYLNADSGTTTVLGSQSRAPETRSRVGYLPGDLRLPTRSAVRDILDFRRRLQRQAGRPADSMDELISRLDVPVDRRFGALSKGNRQKVGLTLALMADPDVLVLDEPTSGLDPLMQDLVLTLVGERRSHGTAVLLSTHILSEAEAIADRVGVLSRGQLVADAPLEKLLRQARQSIEVTLDRPPPADLLDGIDGLSHSHIQGTEVQAVIVGSLAQAIERLAPYGVQRISTRAHELDEMFAQASGESS